jgi:hypothetical protein
MLPKFGVDHLCPPWSLRPICLCRTTLAEAKATFERAPEPKQFWAVDGAGHFDLERYASDEYRGRVVPFLVEWLR